MIGEWFERTMSWGDVQRVLRVLSDKSAVWEAGIEAGQEGRRGKYMLNDLFPISPTPSL